MGATAVVAVMVGLATPAVAVADPFANFGSFGMPNGADGGQLTFARGVAVNRSGNGAPAGSVYVAEAAPNHRISQFTADGDFIRMWGFDVIEPTRPDSSVPPNGNGTGFEICDVTNGNVVSDCKQGLTGGGAGQLGNPSGVAVDQANGYLYVINAANRRVDVFSGSGQFAGGFGWDVNPAGIVGPEICTTVTGCKAAGAAGGDAGRFGAMVPSIPAVDPNVPGRVYVPDPGNLRVAQYSTTIDGGILTTATFDKAFGWDVIPGAPATLESCTTVTGCQASQPTSGGNNPGQFASGGTPGAIAVDSTGAIYATSGPLTAGTCSTDTPCRIQKFSPDATTVTDFGPVDGPGQLVFTSGAANTVAPFNVAIDPLNDHVFVQRRVSPTSYQVLEYDSAGDYIETHPGGDALPTSNSLNNSPGLAVGNNRRIYASLGQGGTEISQVFILGPVDPPSVTIAPVTDVDSDSATFNGTVEIPPPGSPTFDTTYRFEYSSNGVDWTAVPVPDANVGDGTTGTHTVTQSVFGLEPNTLYSVRLVATTGSTVTSNTVSFTTDGAPPRIALTFVNDVTQTEARLGAHIDPEGLATTYHFEWGPTAAYGNRVPGFERQLGDGSTVVVAGEELAGLTAATTYHYRVVATNARDTTVGPGQTFETLNECNLTDDRCYELVSPPDKGAVGNAADGVALAAEPNFQVAPDGSAIQYVIAYGAEDSHAGEEASYVARRESGGWSSEELGPPQLEVNPRSQADDPYWGEGMSSDLSCGFFTSGEPLTDDVPRALIDAGAAALYRRDVGGGWTTVTDLMPVDPGTGGAPLQEYGLVGMSDVAPFDDCERVVFASPFRYPGVSSTGDRKLYRWDEGVLSYVAVIPGPGGPEVVEAVAGASNNPNASDVAQPSLSNVWNAVSQDASRVLFTAISRVGGDVGQQAVFMRELGSSVAVDVSQSRTATPNDDDSVYQTASEDGSTVIFTARTGLAPNDPALGPAGCASPAGEISTAGDGTGCDLYAYSVGGDGVAGSGDDSLTDLSVPEPGTSNPAGVGVAGVLGASDDGEYVYFAARGQLVEGEGYTAAQNLARDTFSVYLGHGGDVEYAGRVGEDDDQVFVARQIVGATDVWSSRVTPDGRHLLFESKANPTGYDSNGYAEAYRYSADDGVLECVSCRTDLKPPTVQGRSVLDGVLPNGFEVTHYLSPPRVISDDGSRVFFISFDRLASGATAGRRNLYQWVRGQVSFIASSVDITGSRTQPRFGGSSSSGDDLFFSTADQMSWEDIDGKTDVYDAKVGGGFPRPADPPPPCDPLAGVCQGGGAPRAPVSEETSSARGGEPSQQPRAALSVRGLTRAQRWRLAAGRSVRVVVGVSRAGKISVRGVARVAGLRARVLSASVRARRAGRYPIRVSLSRAAVRQVRRSGGLRVTLTVRLSGAEKPSRQRLALKAGRASKRTPTNDRRAAK